MRSKHLFSSDPVDRHLSILLQNWAQAYPPPKGGKARLLVTLRSKDLEHLTFRTRLRLLIRLAVYEVFMPPIAPALQPVLYSGGASRDGQFFYRTESARRSAQFTSDISLSMGGGFFSLVA